MLDDFTEKDWKVLRKLRVIALERFCERVLHEIEGLSQKSKNSYHERYLAVYRHLHERNDELADAFDNPRRSMAAQQLALMYWHKLLTDEEMAQFTPGVLELVRSCMPKRKPRTSRR